METQIRMRVDNCTFCIAEPIDPIKSVFLVSLEDYHKTKDPEPAFLALAVLFRHGLKSFKVQGASLSLQFEGSELTDDSLTKILTLMAGKPYQNTLRKFLHVIFRLFTSNSSGIPTEFFDEYGAKLNVEILSVTNTQVH